MAAKPPIWVYTNIIHLGDVFLGYSLNGWKCIRVRIRELWVGEVMNVKKQLTEKELTLLIKQLNLNVLDNDSKDENETEQGVSGNLLVQSGWIQVKDNQIIVNDPIDGGDLPVIGSIPPVRLMINDVYMATECTVSSQDRIHWDIDERALFKITVSDDDLYAYFHLISKERYAWKLADTERLSNIVIMAEQDYDIVLETLQLTDIVAEIERRSIQSHLDVAAIQLELENSTHQPVLIARGKPALPAKDAQLEVLFSEQVESQFFEVSGLVDFRNHLHIPSVKKGELLAMKIPSENGVPGYDVYGRVIMPPPPNDIIVVVKPGVELTPHGEIIARMEGRPRITGEKIKTFDISTSFIVTGDVDIVTGNIVFSGDVIVYGNVTDNMIIESLGNVYVHGNVYNATITATGSIHIRGNVMGCKLYSGYFGVMFNRLYQISKYLSDRIEMLLTAAKMLVQALEAKNQTVRFGQIVLLLIENKFKDIVGSTKELLAVISNIQHIKKDEYQKLKEACDLVCNLHNLRNMVSFPFLQSFHAMLQATHQDVARMQEEKVVTIINQCHNSELKSNGDIIIRRDGVLLSDLYSAGNIMFKHDFSVCRGSKLEAQDSIIAKIVGGETGARTELKAKRQVAVRKMYAGRICIGKYCTEVFDVIENKTYTISNLKHRS